MLEIGAKAPDFTFTDLADKKTTRTDYAGKWLILYFYPKALTPGCTVQACGLRDIKAKLDTLNAVALGISADKASLLTRFTEKKALNFPLAADLTEDKSELKKFHAWGLKKFMGKEYDGIHRITYIISPEGNIAHSIEKVKTKSHHDDVLAWLQKNT